MSKRHKGFTLAEMVVVMGIIVLFITMAIPTIRSLTGTTSIGMTRNNIAALLARAREDAIGVQAVRGVAFFCDPTSNRIIGIIVQTADIQDPNLSTSKCLLLDAVPNRESMALPAGVRLQTVFNGIGTVDSNYVGVYTNSAAGNEDRYLGFNPLPFVVVNSAQQVRIGGVILFDGNGKLISRVYGFQMGGPNTTPSNLCTMLNIAYTSLAAGGNGEIINLNYGSYAIVPGYVSGVAPSCLSQVGLILFNYDAFVAQGFTDDDADIQHPGGNTYANPWPVPTSPNQEGDGIHSEKDEETWLDTNSTPLMVNRYDGTLIRAE